jgi:hypothetical protein
LARCGSTGPPGPPRITANARADMRGPAPCTLLRTCRVDLGCVCVCVCVCVCLCVCVCVCAPHVPGRPKDQARGRAALTRGGPASWAAGSQDSLLLGPRTARGAWGAPHRSDRGDSSRHPSLGLRDSGIKSQEGVLGPATPTRSSESSQHSSAGLCRAVRGRALARVPRHGLNNTMLCCSVIL